MFRMHNLWVQFPFLQALHSYLMSSDQRKKLALYPNQDHWFLWHKSPELWNPINYVKFCFDSSLSPIMGGSIIRRFVELTEKERLNCIPMKSSGSKLFFLSAINTEVWVYQMSNLGSLIQIVSALTMMDWTGHTL